MHFHRALWYLHNLRTCIRARLLDPCFKTGRKGPCHPQQSTALANADTSTRQRQSSMSLVFTYSSDLQLTDKGENHRMHPTHYLHTAKASRQVRQYTAIFPKCPGSLHFQFSKFKHNCLSVQSPVSPFPCGTCLLSVSDKRLALDEHYHLFAHQSKGAQLRVRVQYAEGNN